MLYKSYAANMFYQWMVIEIWFLYVKFALRIESKRTLQYIGDKKDFQPLLLIYISFGKRIYYSNNSIVWAWFGQATPPKCGLC